MVWRRPFRNAADWSIGLHVVANTLVQTDGDIAGKVETAG